MISFPIRQVHRKDSGVGLGCAHKYHLPPASCKRPTFSRVLRGINLPILKSNCRRFKMATATYPAQKLDYHAPFLAINAPSNYEAHQSATPPLGIPSRYEGERVWSGLEMAAKKDEWITILSKEDQAQIVESLRRFQGRKTSSYGLWFI